MSLNFDKELESLTALVEKSLAGYLPKVESVGSIVAEAMAYSLLNGGKRLRPVILLAACKSFSGSAAEALAHGVAMEMIHTYSLIHDDLPAMDNDDYRRGKESCHKKYGEAYGILAGDGLLNLAFEVMNGVSEKLLAEEASSVQLQRSITAAGIVVRAAGMGGMILGQAADIYWEQKSPGEEELIYINQRKTGALLAASFEAGAILGGAEKEQALCYREAGMRIGIAFQIQDDLLDKEGSFENLGKMTGSDEKQGKTTYMTVLGKEGCQARVRELTQEAADLLHGCGANSEFLEELAQYLVGRIK